MILSDFHFCVRYYTKQQILKQASYAFLKSTYDACFIRLMLLSGRSAFICLLQTGRYLRLMETVNAGFSGDE